MNFCGRVMRCAVVCWALYLILALSVFALHTHSAHEVGHNNTPCALCLAHDVTGAVAAVAAFVLLAPVLIWRAQIWAGVLSDPAVAACARLYFSRGPPRAFSA